MQNWISDSSLAAVDGPTGLQQATNPIFHTPSHAGTPFRHPPPTSTIPAQKNTIKQTV